MSAMKWVVQWPAAAFSVGDEDVVVKKGGTVPKGVAPAVIDALKIVGAIAPALAPALDESGEPIPESSRKRPAQD